LDSKIHTSLLNAESKTVLTVPHSEKRLPPENNHGSGTYVTKTLRVENHHVQNERQAAWPGVIGQGSERGAFLDHVHVKLQPAGYTAPPIHETYRGEKTLFQCVVLIRRLVSEW
jgi:hypothetical protein